MKIIIIGDVHGCYNELMSLIKKADISETDDTCIFIGDLIDRGSDPYMVLDYVKGMQKRMPGRCIAIRGNHEQMMLDTIYDFSCKSLWNMNGGGKTIKSFYKHGKHFSMAREWLLTTVLYYENEYFIAAHAGIDKSGPGNTDADTFIWDRHIAEYGDYKGKLFIYGHTPMRYAVYQDGHGNIISLSDWKTAALPRTGSISIDTGCVFGNRLTAMIIEDGMYRVISVPSEKQKNYRK